MQGGTQIKKWGKHEKAPVTTCFRAKDELNITEFIFIESFGNLPFLSHAVMFVCFVIRTVAS